jgi:hypothetical protein
LILPRKVRGQKTHFARTRRTQTEGLRISCRRLWRPAYLFRRCCQTQSSASITIAVLTTLTTTTAKVAPIDSPGDDASVWEPVCLAPDVLEDAVAVVGVPPSVPVVRTVTKSESFQRICKGYA